MNMKQKHPLGSTMQPPGVPGFVQEEDGTLTAAVDITMVGPDKFDPVKPKSSAVKP